MFTISLPRRKKVKQKRKINRQYFFCFNIHLLLLLHICLNLNKYRYTAVLNTIVIYSYLPKLLFKLLENVMLKSNDVFFFPDMGYKEVQFYMAQGCLRNSRPCITANAIDAVCTIVECNLTDLNGHSYDESNNYVNLRINELFSKNLHHWHMKKKTNLGNSVSTISWLTL